MKRKKPPIMLVSVLVVSVLVLAITAKPFGNYSKSMQEQQALLEQEAKEREMAQARQDKPKDQKIDTSAAIKDMKDNLKTVGTPQLASPAGRVAGDDGGKNYKTAVPTVVMPDQEVQKPKPNTTAPSTQWYDKN
jgi:flagellar biosynthesis/type III secretory pathway M-ring protein FliF/YscJ